jgi:hypothetical protein
MMLMSHTQSTQQKPPGALLTRREAAEYVRHELGQGAEPL